jgi:hypothetical protein
MSVPAAARARVALEIADQALLVLAVALDACDQVGSLERKG